MAITLGKVSFGDGGSSGGSRVGALLRQSGQTSLGLFIGYSGADESWHLRGAEREAAEPSVAATARIAHDTSNYLDLTFADASDTREKKFTPLVGNDRNDFPEQVNEYQFTAIQWPAPVSEVKASYDYGDLRVTSRANAGATGNADTVQVSIGNAATSDVNAHADIPLYNGTPGVLRAGQIRVTSPNASVRASVLLRTGSRNNGTVIARLRWHEPSTAGNGFQLNLQVSRNDGGTEQTVATYASDNRSITAVITGTAARRNDYPWNELIAAINAARTAEGDQLVVADGLGSTSSINFLIMPADGATESMSESGNALPDSVTLAGGGVETAVGADTNVGGVRLLSGDPSRTVAGATAVINVAPPGDTAVRMRLTYTGTSRGAAGNSRVANVVFDSSIPGNTVAITADHTDGDIEIAFGPGTVALATILTALTGNVAREGGGDSGYFVSAEIIENDDRVTTVTWASTDSNHSTARFSGGYDAGREPLSASWDVTSHTLTVTALDSDAASDVITAITALDQFGTSVGPGYVRLAGGGLSNGVVNVDNTVGNTLEYDFAGGTDATARSALVVVNRNDPDGDGNRLDIRGLISGDTTQDVLDAYTGNRFTLTSISGDGTTAFSNPTALAATSLTGGVTQVVRQDPAVYVSAATDQAITYTIWYHGSQTAAGQRTTLTEMKAAWDSIDEVDGLHGASPQTAITGTGSEVVATIPAGPTGGADREDADVLEAIARPEDEDHGPNVEIRYDATEDDLQAIHDALEAQGVVTVVGVYGVDLTASPEEPPFTRTMFLAAGVSEGISGVTIEDESTALTTAATTLDFQGAGVTATGTGTTKTITIPGASGGGLSGIEIKDEGTALTTDATGLNFTGDGVAATGNGAEKTVNIPGGIAGVEIKDEGTALSTDATGLNFTGDGVTVTGNGAEKTVSIPGDEFDLHDDVSRAATSINANALDRFLISQESVAGDPNAYITAANVRTFMKGYVGTWTSRPGGFVFRKGDITDHSSRWYVTVTQHTKQANGPDSDSTNFVSITSWGGAWATGFFQPGIFVTHASNVYVSIQDILNTDPAPNANTNTKWVQINGGGSTGISGIEIKDEGTALTTDATGLNFTGDGVTVTGNGAEKTVTIPGGSGGTTVVANPGGTAGGGDLTTITIDGTVYDIPAGSGPSGEGGAFVTEIGRGTVTVRSGRTIDTGIDIPDTVGADEWWAFQLPGTSELGLFIFKADQLTGLGNIAIGTTGINANTDARLIRFLSNEGSQEQTIAFGRTAEGDITFVVPGTTVTPSAIVLYRMGTGDSGGTEVEANPSGAVDSGSLTKVDIDGSVYSVGTTPTSLDGIPIPAWAVRNSYVEGELVRDTHDRVFMCITAISQSNNAPATDATHFGSVSGFAGAYADSTAYPVGVLVTHSSNAWFVATAVAATNTDGPGTNAAFLRVSGPIVEANPDGDADGGDITKLSVDGTIYSVPAGVFAISEDPVETVTLSGTTAASGPDFSDLTDLIWMSFNYTRINASLRFNTFVRKSDIEGVAVGSAYRLQGQGAGGAYFNLYDVSGDLTFTVSDGTTSYTAAAVEIYNVVSSTSGGTAGATSFDALTDTPAAKVAGQYPRVNTAADALAYYDTDADIGAARRTASAAHVDLVPHVGAFVDATAADVAELFGVYASPDTTYSDSDFVASQTLTPGTSSPVLVRLPKGMPVEAASVRFVNTDGSTNSDIPSLDPLAPEYLKPVTAPSDAPLGAAYYEVADVSDGSTVTLNHGGAGNTSVKLRIAPLTYDLADLGSDVLSFWVLSTQHADFDALGFGDTITLKYGQRNVNTDTVTVRAISRSTNVATVVIDAKPLGFWPAVIAAAGGTVIVEDSSGNQIGGWTASEIQTTRAGVSAATEWWLAVNVPTAGTDVWRELDRIDALDDTHLTLGTRTATTLDIDSSTGNNVTVPSASTTLAGLQSAADKTQISALPPTWVTATAYDAGVQRVWQGILYECILARTITDTSNPATDTTGWASVTATGTTDLSVGTRTATGMVVESSSGTDVTLPVATASDAGLQSATDKGHITSLPQRWVAKAWTAGQQCSYGEHIYSCVTDRETTDVSTPDNDSTGWALVAPAPDLSGYVTTTALAAYSNTTAMNTAIANALANLDALVDKGAWNTTDSFDEHDFVRHSGASYVALGSVNAGIEPGVTSGWNTSWYRLAYSDGPPTALTTPSIEGQVLSFPDIGGTTHQITIPVTGEADTAPATRVERVTFQAAAAAQTAFEGVPLSTNPLSVIYPDGAERSIITSLSGNDFTLKAGVYLVNVQASIDGTVNSTVQFFVRDASDDSNLTSSTNEILGSSDATTADMYATLVLTADTAVNIYMSRMRAAASVAANWTATFTRWGGSTSFDPLTLGVDTFSLTGAQQDIALTDDTSGNAILCPETGWLMVESLIPGLGLNNKVDWYNAARLRADKTAGDGLYTTAANEIMLRVAAHEGGATTGNIVRVFYTGETGTGSVTPPPVILPHIRTFRITGDKTPPAGSLQGDTYGYEVQVSQTHTVFFTRIIGYGGSSIINPTTFNILVRNIDDPTDATGTITMPNITLNANQQYTIRLEVYPTGTSILDAPQIYADYTITAVAASLNTHFGYVTSAEDETDIVFATDDISTAADAAGNWTVTLPDASDYRLYWAVPTANTQPTNWTTAGFNINAGIETVENVTLGGDSYTVYLTEADAPYDNSSNGTVLVVT